LPEKRDSYSSYGQKLISLFAKLLFTQRSHSLIELSRMLNCSKQTVLRLVDDIRRSYGVEIEESVENRRKYYRIKKYFQSSPAVNLTEAELQSLYMCQAFAEHLMGKQLYDDATRALEKSHTLMQNQQDLSSHHFASFVSGRIDYTPHQEHISLLIEAMNNRKICKLTYKSITASKAKSFFIKPLKIFSHRDAMYIHAQLARKPGKKYREPDYDPLLAVHRIKHVEITERLFEFPKKYDFEKIFKVNFGVIKDDAFEVEVEFQGWAAKYVSERIWSPDQKVHIKNGKTKLTFSASSEPELISWVMSFGENAKVIKPKWLIEIVKRKLMKIRSRYVEFNSVT
jgi:predicted DNA-binding transcriptional regulator YafY